MSPENGIYPMSINQKEGGAAWAVSIPPLVQEESVDRSPDHLDDVATRLNRSLSDTLEYLQDLGISGNAGAADALASFASLEG